MISLIICLIIALVIAALALGVVRAVLALPPFNPLAPYGAVIYALVMLLCGLLIVQYCFFGGYPGIPRLH